MNIQSKRLSEVEFFVGHLVNLLSKLICYLGTDYRLYNIHSLSSPQRHQNLSSALKERLRRSRRSFTSPFSVAKRLCVDEEEEDGRQVSADHRETVNNPSLITPSEDVNRNVVRLGRERLSGSIPKTTHPPLEDSTHQRDKLRKEVKAKMETLRRLKMVKMYRSKVSVPSKLSGLELFSLTILKVYVYLSLE